MRAQVLVVLDGRDVVEYEAALQRVPVGGRCHDEDDHRRQTPQGEGRPVGHRPNAKRNCLSNVCITSGGDGT